MRIELRLSCGGIFQRGSNFFFHQSTPVDEGETVIEKEREKEKERERERVSESGGDKRECL